MADPLPTPYAVPNPEPSPSPPGTPPLTGDLSFLPLERVEALVELAFLALASLVFGPAGFQAAFSAIATLEAIKKLFGLADTGLRNLDTTVQSTIDLLLLRAPEFTKFAVLSIGIVNELADLAKNCPCPDCGPSGAGAGMALPLVGPGQSGIGSALASAASLSPLIQAKRPAVNVQVHNFSGMPAEVTSDTNLQGDRAITVRVGGPTTRNTPAGLNPSRAVRRLAEGPPAPPQ